jgi:transposase
MTRRPIIAYLSLKGMSAREIHEDIVTILEPDAVSYSAVTRYLREARFPPSKSELRPADIQKISMLQIRIL